MTYRITYETADGSIEEFCTETNRARAEKTVRRLAKESPLNEPFEISRWFVEANDQAINVHSVTA